MAAAQMERTGGAGAARGGGGWFGRRVRRGLGAAAAAATLAGAGVLASCGESGEGAANAGAEGARQVQEGPVSIVVSIPPLLGLVQPLAEAVGGTAESVVPPGASAHGYEPAPARLASVARANIVVLVGRGMDTGIERAVTGKGMVKTFRLSELVDEPDAGEDGHDHGHEGHDHAAHDDHDHEGHDHAGHDHDDHGHDHDHAEGDPHLWLNPEYAVSLVEAVHEALAREAPVSDIGRLGDARSELIARIRSTDEAFRRTVEEASAGGEAPTIVVGHDAYRQWTRRYGLGVVAVAGLDAAEPTPGGIARAIDAVNRTGARAVFVEPQMNPAAAQRVAEQTGLPLLELDPLGDGDWLAMMAGNLAALREAFGLEGE